jgi:hypothetical protein
MNAAPHSIANARRAALNDRARKSADSSLQKPRLLAAWVTVERWCMHADLGRRSGRWCNAESSGAASQSWRGSSNNPVKIRGNFFMAKSRANATATQINAVS